MPGVEPGEGKGGAPPIQPLPHILPLPLGRCTPSSGYFTSLGYCFRGPKQG